MFDFELKTLSEGTINSLGDSYPFSKLFLLIPFLVPVKELVDESMLNPFLFLLVDLETFGAFFYEILLIFI